MSHLTSNNRRGVIKFRRPLSTGSASVASEAHRKAFQVALCELMETISLEEVTGYFHLYDLEYENFNATVLAAINTAFTAGAAIVGGADPTPAKPVWMKDVHYTQLVNMYGPAANVASPLGIALAGAPPAAVQQVPKPLVLIDQSDFDYLFLQWLMNLAHSGAVSNGDYRQLVQFTINDTPRPPHEHSLEMSEINQLLPTGVTPLNMVNAYADFIVENAKYQDISFDWGRKHGAVGIPGYLGFVGWPYVSNKYINDDQREILRLASAAAIRDKRKQNFEDPSYVEQAEEENSKLAAEQLAHVHANRERLTSYSLAPHVILRQNEEERRRRSDAFRNFDRRQRERDDS